MSVGKKQAATFDKLAGLVGERFIGEPFSITADQRDRFRTATWLDRAYPGGAAEEYPADMIEGFLSLSLLDALERFAGVVDPETTWSLNYGGDRVRFIAPIFIGDVIEPHFEVLDVTPKGDGFILLKRATLNAAGRRNPSVSADWRTLVLPRGVPSAPQSGRSPRILDESSAHGEGTKATPPKVRFDQLEALVGSKTRGAPFTISAEDQALWNQACWIDRAYPDEDLDFPEEIIEGFFSLSLLDALARFAGPSDDENMWEMNYGLDRVRFPSPMYFGDRITPEFGVLEVRSKGEGYALLRRCTLTAEGADRPGVVADWWVYVLRRGIENRTIPERTIRGG